MVPEKALEFKKQLKSSVSELAIVGGLGFKGLGFRVF